MRMLYRQDSIAVYIRLIRLYIRLCGQIKGGDAFVTTIQPIMNNLIQKL
jgi:hypothetical protein